MSILTTTIGAYPKPEHVPITDWFSGESTTARHPTTDFENCDQCQDTETKNILDRATREVVQEQIDLGIDVPTDGEVRRENYIHYHCRHLEGFDFVNLTRKAMRSGHWEAAVPTVAGPIKTQPGFLVHDWQVAQAVSPLPVKITIPGPLTIIDSTYDSYYGDEHRLAADLATAINSEVRKLAEAGCRWIQIDEPVFARYPDKALAFGIENLERCFHGIVPAVNRTIHICCGYPDRIDSKEYQKAPPENYFRLAAGLNDAALDVISIEDAHRPNDLALLDLFKRQTIILGVVGIARSRIESVEEIALRIQAALNHIDKERLMVAPDCGLGMLTHNQIKAKLANMVTAAKRIR